jgi:hypothetical protein
VVAAIHVSMRAMKSTDILAIRANLTPDREALVDVTSGMRYAYKELDQRANRVAKFLQVEGLPQNILGYERSTDTEKILILLNFDDQEKKIQMEGTECIFKLTSDSRSNGNTIRLDAYGALILKHR